MTIHELKISSYLFTRFSNYDSGYRNIHNKAWNLSIVNDQESMIEFLRQWGCRQFETKYTHVSKRSLNHWYTTQRKNLPRPAKKLITVSNRDIRANATIFDTLAKEMAGKKVVGPVGAAKCLFALCPDYFAPWDNPIADQLGYSKDGYGYCEYLIDIKKRLLHLKKECNEQNINIHKLPQLLHRSYTSLPKLIDEFFWVSITRGCIPSEIKAL